MLLRRPEKRGARVETPCTCLSASARFTTCSQRVPRSSADGQKFPLRTWETRRSSMLLRLGHRVILLRERLELSPRG